MTFNITDTMLSINESVVIANGGNHVINKTLVIPGTATEPFSIR